MVEWMKSYSIIVNSMSWNNSIEIVTQKELEGVLGNKAFNVDQFLKVYEEWKQTHDSGSFALLRTMHQNAGYKNKNMIFGSESEMHEIAAIVKKFKDGKVEISTTVTAGTAAVAATNLPSGITQQVTTMPTPALESEYKYSLEKYASYASRELWKSGKTIQDLQEKLKEKKCYSGDITGTFDKATLDAVRAFQQSVPNIKYGVDGLVGTVTIGKLFGDATPSDEGSSRPEDTESDGPRSYSSEIPATARVSDNNPNQPESAEVSPTMVQLTQAMEEFRKTYQAVNQKTNKLLPDHEKDIELRNKSIQDAAKPVDKILQSLDPSKLSEQERKTYESMKLEVAKYFSNELSGIKSRQYTDYQFAFSLAESIIAPILKESNITLPKSPTQDDVEKRMKSINPSLHARYTEALRKWWTPGQFLSNPKIRAEWADVQSKINGEYEESVQKKLAELIGNKAVLKTPEQYEALMLMRTIIGSSNFLDFKKRNIDAWIQTGGAIGSGIGGAIAWVGIVGVAGWTGVGAVAGASVIGASLATLGWALSRGRYDERYLFTEWGINLVTFWVAGKIWMIAKAKYIDQWSKIAGYSLDGTAGLALGVSGEYTRALSDGANFKDLPHGKMILMQLPWALLPMTMGGLAHLKWRAQNIDKAVQTIRSQANVWDQAGAARTAQAIAPEVESVANVARAQVQRDHVVTPLKNEQQFTEWFTTLIPQVDKKRFPVGSTIKSEWVEITALAWWKYSLKHGENMYKYDNHAELTENIGKIIKTPSERIALLKSTESTRILNHMKWFADTEVPGVPWLRWKHDGHGKMSFERNNPENGSWSAVEIAALTPDEQIAAAAHWYSIKPSQIREGIKKVEWETAHDMIKSAWLWWWFKERPVAVQKSIESWLSGMKTSAVDWTKYVLWDWPKSLFSMLTGIWKTDKLVWNPFLLSLSTEVLDLIANPEERDPSMANVVEFIWRMTAIKYMGVWRWTAAVALQNWATGVYIDAPWAQVPVQK